MINFNLALLVSLLLLSVHSFANDYTYSNIATRYSETSLDNTSVAAAKMQGECLVGLKELNFKKKDTFDPVAEWTNYRSASLLEQYSPCEVLIMMEVAQAKLKSEE